MIYEIIKKPRSRIGQTDSGGNTETETRKDSTAMVSKKDENDQAIVPESAKDELAEVESGFSDIVEFDPMNSSLVGGLTNDFLGRQKYDDDDLRNIVDFDQFLAHIGDTADFSEDIIGTGGEYIAGGQLDRLMETRFVFLQWSFIESSEYNSWFVLCEVLTEENKRYTFVAGTKFGLRDTLAKHTLRTGRRNGLVASKGLSRRDYEWPPEPAPGEKQHTVLVYDIAR